VDDSLLDLLGDTRARVVLELNDGPRGVAEIAAALQLTEVAVRRHLHALEHDGLIDAETVRRDGPGRPAARYRLTERGRRLLPDRSAELANELLEFLEADGGRRAVLRFLRWRRARQQARYADGLDADASPAQRAEQLAQLLSDDGFPSRLEADGDSLILRQQHCAIRDVAAENPELCAFEAAMFRDLLGVEVTRRETIAGGHDACRCHLAVDAAEPAAGDAPCAPPQAPEQAPEIDTHPPEPTNPRPRHRRASDGNPR
jgi:predicted ArsR family transcriptional regulator